VTTTAPAVDERRLMEFVFKAVGDLGALLTGSMVVIGDRLGLYRALAGAGPLTAAGVPCPGGPRSQGHDLSFRRRFRRCRVLAAGGRSARPVSGP
jgi:hypothetical protein